jgi:cytochrome c
MCHCSVCRAGEARGGRKAGGRSRGDPESIANGAALYKRQCVMCHGATGMGDGPAAKNLKGKLPVLSDKATMSKLTDAQIHEAITAARRPRSAICPRSASA